MSRRFLLAVVVALGLSGEGALAQDAHPAPAPVQLAVGPPPDEMVTLGRSLYAQHCSHCHGFNMVNPGTISYDLRTFPHDDKPRFVNSVTHGKNGRMPPWGDVLSAKELDELWSYILTGGK